MPKALPNEVRQLAAALYAQGLMPAAIAQQTGLSVNTICKWSTRYGWTAARDSSKELHKQNTLNAQLAEQSAKLKSQVTAELDRIQTTLANTRPKRDLQHLRSRAAVVESTVAAASKLFGWSEEQSRSPINISVLHLPLSQRPDALPPASTTVEVESVVRALGSSSQGPEPGPEPTPGEPGP